MINQSINLNLIPGAIPPRIKVSQYDEGSRTLTFMLYNGSSQYAGDTGITAKIQGTKPDGHGFCYDATYGQETGYCYVTADLTRQMTVVAGAVTCEIVLEKNSQVLGTGNFILDVEAGALSDDTDISDTEIPAIIDAAETNAERAEDAADRAEAASAHAPYIGNNDHWYVWDSTNRQYVDSGVDAKGEDGASIVSVTKTSTSGYVDTYTITMSDGTTSTFTVTNGTSTLPGGGTKGQVLTKKSGTTGDADWSSDLELGQTALLSSTVGWTGKNLGELVTGYAVAGDPSIGYNLDPNANGAVCIAKVEQNKAYIASRAVGDRFRVVLFKNYPTTAHQTDASKVIDDATLNEAEFNSGSYNYVVFGVNAVGTIPSGINAMIRDARISDSTYEPHHDSVDACKYNRSEASVLGAKNWFDPNAIRAAGGSTPTITNDGQTIRLVGNNAGQYGNKQWRISVKPNTYYKISSDVTITAGAACIKIANTGGTQVAITQTLTSAGRLEKTFNTGNNTELDFVLFTSWDTSVAGDVTYLNLMLTLSTDTDTTFQPYAMTNRELTTFLTLSEGACTDIVTGATVSDAQGGNHLYKNGRIVQMILALEGVTINAWSNIAKLPDDFKPIAGITALPPTRSLNKTIYIQLNGAIQCAENLSNANINIFGVWIAKQ